MIPDSLREITDMLPWSLRQDIHGYVSSVDDQRYEIADDAGVELNADRRRRLLFAMGVRRMWAIVNGSYWILDNSLNRLRQCDVHRLQMGSTFYGRQTSSTQQLRDLRSDLAELIDELEIHDVVESTSLPDVLRRIS